MSLGGEVRSEVLGGRLEVWGSRFEGRKKWMKNSILSFKIASNNLIVMVSLYKKLGEKHVKNISKK